MLKGDFWVEFFECIAESIYVFVGPVRAKQVVDQSDVPIIKLPIFIRIIHLEDSQSAHHVWAFGAVGALAHDGRNHDLKIGADGNQCVPIELVGHFGEGKGWIPILG